MTDAQFTQILSKYLPQNSVNEVVKKIKTDAILLKITPKRKTVLGNYRPPHRQNGHQITINADLNPYAFLLTLIHEFAHLETWKKHQNTVRPHGEEWAEMFRREAEIFLQKNIFPKELAQAIRVYLQKPSAATCRDDNLYRLLRSYDKTTEDYTELEKLPENSLFRLEDGRLFRKGEKLRKYYRCEEQTRKLTYRVHALMLVMPMPENIEPS